MPRTRGPVTVERILVHKSPSGPAVVRMLSNNGPPFPMRMQVPPVVQQIVDESGILSPFLSPQHPGMMGNQMPGGPNSPYYPPYSGPYSNHPAPYPTHPHAHPGGPPHRVSTPHMPHQTPPAAATCDNHNPAHTQGHSPPLPNMDERTQKKHLDLRRKIRNRADYNRGQPQRSRRNRENGMDMDRAVSITNSETQTQVGDQRDEYGRALQAELSKMPTPKVSDIEPRSAFIKYYPPDFDSKDFDVNPSKFLYDLMLCEKGRDGKYTCVYQGDASEIALKDLKPATEYHLKVCAVFGDYRGSPTEAISFMTKTCEPDPPQPPKFDKKSKSSISLKWNNLVSNWKKQRCKSVHLPLGDPDNLDEQPEEDNRRHKTFRQIMSEKENRSGRKSMNVYPMDDEPAITIERTTRTMASPKSKPAVDPLVPKLPEVAPWAKDSSGEDNSHSDSENHQSGDNDIVFSSSDKSSTPNKILSDDESLVKNKSSSNISASKARPLQTQKSQDSVLQKWQNSVNESHRSNENKNRVNVPNSNSIIKIITQAFEVKEKEVQNTPAKSRRSELNNSKTKSLDLNCSKFASYEPTPLSPTTPQALLPREQRFGHYRSVSDPYLRETDQLSVAQSATERYLQNVSPIHTNQTTKAFKASCNTQTGPPCQCQWSSGTSSSMKIGGKTVKTKRTVEEFTSSMAFGGIFWQTVEY
ncbi:uncharacterized protein LOC127869783 [Dreissena polymorpha]|uniref:uncharacterized protein LOC127869783 n=1 Tax=Dreissena polymorpha TaxID=45954 RepID=UPI0022654037|nr:uncharacterized protein LOC127869783 [Dreissena polymorpha]